MPSTTANLAPTVMIARALSEDQDLIDTPEHCKISKDIVAALGVRDGSQVRVFFGSEVALYTIAGVLEESRMVRMGKSGRARLLAGGVTGVSLSTPTDFNTAPGVVIARAVRHDLSDAEARAQGELVERAILGGTFAYGLAPHGGDIELGTDVQAFAFDAAIRAGGQTSSAWACLGFRSSGAHSAWHITATDTDPGSFPALGVLLQDRARHAVSFHGAGGDEIILGGAAPMALRVHVADAIRQVVPNAKLTLPTSGGSLGGASPRNLVNRAAVDGAGIQIEQPLDIRKRYAKPIAEAVARVILAAG